MKRSIIILVTISWLHFLTIKAKPSSKLHHVPHILCYDFPSTPKCIYGGAEKMIESVSFSTNEDLGLYVHHAWKYLALLQATLSISRWRRIRNERAKNGTSWEESMIKTWCFRFSGRHCSCSSWRHQTFCCDLYIHVYGGAHLCICSHKHILTTYTCTHTPHMFRVSIFMLLVFSGIHKFAEQFWNFSQHFTVKVLGNLDWGDESRVKITCYSSQD